MGVGGVSGGSGGSGIAELMKILEMGQAQTLDLAKKLIKVNQQEATALASEGGLGQNIDVMA
ncbi:hypothetical protein AUK22_10490 [bacterium CG2_30_54_10]|nr:MAG: hypothetical protein AUK22_10490 [bacterium CG2_30_54_10]